MDPPGYNSLADDILPAYSQERQHRRQQAPAEHLYELTNKYGPWASLKVQSNARKTRQLPTFFEGDPIKGSFSLHLAKEDHITSIRVVVKGQLLVIENECIINGSPSSGTGLPFLELSTTLWSKESSSQKLPGSHEWPFRFTLPKEVTFQGQACILPETFQERNGPTSIQYDIEVHIVRSRFRVDSKLRSMFVYIPSIRPPPPSTLRQLAYQQGNSLPVPETDPEGWACALQPTGEGSVLLQGAISSARTDAVSCTLHVAQPNMFTRGAPLPLYITFSSTNRQVLDLIAKPESIRVTLTKRTSRPSNVSFPAQPGPLRKTSPFYFADDSINPRTGRSPYGNCHEVIVRPAVWWLHQEPDLVTGGASRTTGSGSNVITRNFYGEIDIPSTIKPTTNLGGFSIEYVVILHPFSVPGITRLDPSSVPSGSLECRIPTGKHSPILCPDSAHITPPSLRPPVSTAPATSPRTPNRRHSRAASAALDIHSPLLSHPIQIATLFPRGTKPRSMAPPDAVGGFDTEASITQEDPMSARNGSGLRGLFGRFARTFSS